MATVSVSASQPGAAVPFASLTGATRAPGAGSATVVTVTLANGVSTVTLFGSGFTYDAQALPAGGTITAILFSADGSVPSWTANAFSVGAATFRTNAASLGTFLFGAADSVTGAAAADLLAGYGGQDTLVGGGGNDSLLGGNGSDSLSGGLGSDSLVGSFGNDTMLGGNDADTLVGGDGNDSLRGEAGTDSILGGNGNDTVSTSAGGDRIDLGVGDDLLSGLLDPGSVVEGGTGDDVLRIGATIEFATISGFEVLEWSMPNAVIRALTAQLQAFTTFRRAEPDPLGVGGLEVRGGGVLDLGAVTFDFQPDDLFLVRLDSTTAWDFRGRDSTLSFADDDVFFSAQSGNDTVQTFGGNDRVSSRSGNDSILTGEGNDEVNIGSGSNIVLLGGGNDTLGLSILTTVSGANTVDGGSGNDIIAGLAGGDSLLGGLGNDSILGDSGFLSGAGNDRIFGGAGVDTISGGGGADLLRGGTSADRVSGGSGADTFAFDDNESGVLRNGVLTGADTITDFSRRAGDKFDLSLVDANTAVLGDQAFTQLLAASSQVAIGAGSLRYQIGPGATTISGSTDADVDFEFRIIVLTTATYTPLPGDFIL